MPSTVSDGPSVALSFANNFWGKDDAGVEPLLQRMLNAKQTSDELKSFYTGRSRRNTVLEITLTMFYSSCRHRRRLCSQTTVLSTEAIRITRDRNLTGLERVALTFHYGCFLVSVDHGKEPGKLHEQRRLENCVGNSLDQNHAFVVTRIEDGAGYYRTDLETQNGMLVLCPPAFQDEVKHCVGEPVKLPLACRYLEFPDGTVILTHI
jgi:hypothetical protein